MTPIDGAHEEFDRTRRGSRRNEAVEEYVRLEYPGESPEWILRDTREPRVAIHGAITGSIVRRFARWRRLRKVAETASECEPSGGAPIP
jgi:hypothetical protein